MIPWNFIRSVSIQHNIDAEYDEKHLTKIPETVKFGAKMLNFNFIHYFAKNKITYLELCLQELNNEDFKTDLPDACYMEDISKVVNILLILVTMQKPRIFCIITSILFWKWEIKTLILEFQKKKTVCHKMSKFNYSYLVQQIATPIDNFFKNGVLWYNQERLL